MNNHYNADYEELSGDLQYQQDLTSFFSQTRDYKSILDHAISDNHHEVIKELSNNLSLNIWFDKQYIQNKIEIFMKDFPEQINLFTWCMTMAEVRTCFTPEEKGQFVYFGLTFKNFEMVYHATLDNDWIGKLPDNIIEIELERLSKNSILKFTDNHIKMDYLHWYKNTIFPRLTEKDQFIYMLGVLNMSVGQLRQISEIHDLAEIGFNIEHAVSLEKISSIKTDLKKVIFHLKDELCFDHWEDNERHNFAMSNVSYIPKGAAELIDINKLKKTADKLTTFINYKKLNNELNELPYNENIVTRKHKI